MRDTRSRKDSLTVGANVIISYDGTPNDDDALALGKMLAQAGFELALAYVRQSREFDPRREEVAQHDADQRLERGAATSGDAESARHETRRWIRGRNPAVETCLYSRSGPRGAEIGRRRRRH
jgi:hypothetical protein